MPLDLPHFQPPYVLLTTCYAPHPPAPFSRLLLASIQLIAKRPTDPLTTKTLLRADLPLLDETERGADPEVV